MHFSASLETKLLIECARPAPRTEIVEELVTLRPEWERILDRADLYGVGPIVYSNLMKTPAGSRVPPPIRRELRTLYRGNVARNTYCQLKLRDILAAFDQQQIPVLLLKGAALAVVAYSDPGLRTMEDLDLLIHRDDLNPADAVLRRLGYDPDESFQPAAWYKNHHHHLPPYLLHDRSLVVELHQHIVRPTDSCRIPIDDLWRRARPARFMFGTALVFSTSDLLLHACLHISLGKYFVQALRDLCDIASIIQSRGEEIDWQDLVERAEGCGACACVRTSLGTAECIAGASVPPGILKSLGSASGGRALENHALTALVPKALFADQSQLPPWVLQELIRELLSSKSRAGKIYGIVRKIVEPLTINSE